MIPRRPLLLCAALAALALSAGCSSRQSQVEMEELRADNERLTSEITALSKENLALAEQRDKARDENQRLRAHIDSMESQIRDFGTRAVGIGIQGLTATPEGAVAMGQDFAFKTGSADLNDQALRSLKQLADLLNSAEYNDTFVIVEGHTDDTPVVRRETVAKFGDNYGLSAMRAAAVVRALEGAGINPKRIRGAFRGEHAPRQTGKSKEAKAANRRVEIFLQLPAGA